MLVSVMLLLAALLRWTAASALGRGKFGQLSAYRERDVSGVIAVEPRQSSGFWLTELGPLGKAPLAGGNYTFWRNIKDYGAKGDGSTDDTAAINRAIATGGRCGEDCGNSFSLGAIVYFPPGIYKICKPIVQFYYTQFVGDPTNRAVIKGCDNFQGPALIDTDPYASGGQWYVNQNQFFRHIRNLEFDLTEMPRTITYAGQRFAPTGIHWQVSQATSLQNLKFTMPQRSDATHVGIDTENGSGGFVSDLEFVGGAIGWNVGTQQYTAQKMKFSGCKTAIVMKWGWGFTWQQIDISDVNVAWDITARNLGSEQGVGSISVIDSKIRNAATGIMTRENRDEQPPSIVLDNLQTSNVTALVKAKDTGSVLLDGKVGVVKLWAAGLRYKAGKGSYQVGQVTDAPARPSALLSGEAFFVKTRPQYSDLGTDNFLIATKYGLSNDGTGDQTSKMNAFLKDAASVGKIAYFPAGIYLVKGTVIVPTGSRLQGSSWSQIMATGSYFGNMKDPKVVLQVGNEGDVGSVEIVEMMITAKGSTAGAIMVEWNVRADKPGSAGMWDSHIRVGGAEGTGLDVANCPKGSFSEKCICSSLLLHVRKGASGYFENVWSWIADHDNDQPVYHEEEATRFQISIYGARGILIESEDPSWFYGGASEHAVLYQYQLVNAKNVFLGHLQTEAPYFQPNPGAPTPFAPALGKFSEDPDFSHCTTDSCKMAWGVRVIDSSDVYIHGMGLYSWYQDYTQDCVDDEDCQDQIFQVQGSANNVAVFNIFTKASIEVASGGKGDIIPQEGSKNGFTTEISVWIPESA